jgi:hypothetical protein
MIKLKLSTIRFILYSIDAFQLDNDFYQIYVSATDFSSSYALTRIAYETLFN